MTLELQVQEPVLPRDRRIRDVFEGNGGAMTIRDLAHACVDADIWTRDELDLIAFRSVQEQCRRVLREKDSGGLPKVSRTTDTSDDGLSIWKQRELWLPGDYELNCAEHISQRDEGHTIAVKLAAECEIRFGVAIDIPELPDPA